MNLIKAIILGIVQGLSEFLPISSSGHLVLVQQILGFSEGGLAFEVFVHFGTLMAVIWVFRKDIVKMILATPDMFRLTRSDLPEERREYARLNLFILIGSVPAAVIGLLFEDAIEGLFESHLLVLGMLFITGLIMWSSRYTRSRGRQMKGWHAFLIGFAQAFAILPGISRSGSTIVSGLWMGLDRQKVARFSFLLSGPVIFGATLLKAKEIWDSPLPNTELFHLLMATIAAMVAGYFAIVWLLKIIRDQKLEWFGVYCIAVSIIGLILVLWL
ncbi:MAG: undecaprenyl-diphosphatase UppP [Calditrichia bacterium]